MHTHKRDSVFPLVMKLDARGNCGDTGTAPMPPEIDIGWTICFLNVDEAVALREKEKLKTISTDPTRELPICRIAELVDWPNRSRFVAHQGIEATKGML